MLIILPHLARGATRHAAPLFLAACAFLAPCTSARAVGADETWQWTMQKRPDGTIVKPPAILGILTVKNGVEHMVVYWTTPDGKPASVSEVFKREWGATQIKPTPMLKIFDDGSGKPPLYEVGGDVKITPITRSGKRVSFQDPLNPNFVEMNGDKSTATFDGGLVDYWERVR